MRNKKPRENSLAAYAEKFAREHLAKDCVMTPQEQLKEKIITRQMDYAICKKCEGEIASGEPHYFAKADEPFTDGPYHLRCCPLLPVNA